MSKINSPEYDKLIEELKEARGARDAAWKSAAQALVLENELASKRKLNLADDAKVALVEAELVKKLLTFRKSDETAAGEVDARFLSEELGFPLFAKHPFADGAPQMSSVSSSAPNNAVFENNNTRSVSVSSVVDKMGWNSFSQSFMESVRRSEGVVNFVPAASGFGFSVINIDGKKFDLIKPDNTIPQSSQESLFMGRVFYMERVKKLGTHNGLVCDSALCTNFVSNALLLHGDYVDCEVYMESLRLLRKFMECHMFFKFGKNYPVFEEFIRGEFSTESLFHKDKPVNFESKLNIFSLLDKPFPRKESEVTMDFAVRVIQRWLEFLQCVCWVHPNVGIDWSMAFDPLIKRLTIGDLFTRGSNMVLEIFNRILANWFRLVKNPFYIDEIHFSFAPQKSAIILLSVLLSKLSITTEVLSDFMQKSIEGRALRCYEHTCDKFINNHNSNNRLANNNSVQPCLKWICSSILNKNEHSFFCSPNESACSRVHLKREEVIEMKENIIKMISTSKKCNEKFREESILCLQNLSE